MSARSVKTQVQNNGRPKTVDNAALAELVNPAQDVSQSPPTATSAPASATPEAPPTAPDLDDALGADVRPPAPRPEVKFDLDDALGDEDALRSDTLADKPPRIEVREPRKREYIMVHPTHSRVATVIEYAPEGGVGRSWYLATGAMKRYIEEEDQRTVELLLCQSLRGRILFIWPRKLNFDGRENAWNRSSEDFANDAKTRWARRVNRGGAYSTKWGPADEPPAKWPERPFKEMIGEGFAEHIIDSPENPVYRHLEGRQ